MLNQAFRANRHYSIQNILGKELIQYLVLNKLCYDNEIFLIKDWPLQLEREDLIYLKESEEQNQEDDSKNVFESIRKNVSFNKNANLLKLFLRLVLNYIWYHLILGIYYAFSTMFSSLYNLKHIYERIIMYVFAFYIIFGQNFFFTYCSYGLLSIANASNLKFYGINALTLTQCIYFHLFLAGTTMIVFYLRQYQTKENFYTIEELEIPSDQLFIESMDRNNLKNLMKNTVLERSQRIISIYSFISNYDQSTSNFTYKMTQQQQQQYRNLSKTWNSGFILLQYEQLGNSNQIPTFFIIFLAILGFTFFIIHFILPIIYLSSECGSSFDRYNLALIVFINILYAAISIINIIFQILLSEGFSKAETFTSLLEIKNSIRGYSFKKNIPTINFCCIQSIKTWFNIRLLMLNVNQNFFRFVNILQTIEIVSFLTLSSILLIDFLGFGWETDQISDNKLLLGLILTNILKTVLLIIIPLFINFSYVNSLLQYNKEQIYNIKGKLNNICSNYEMIRYDQQNQIDQLLKEGNLNVDNQQDLLEKLTNNQDQTLFKGKRTTHQITKLRIVFEIIRNTELYSINQNFQQSSYNELSEGEKIIREKKYLSQLIKTYKNIYQDMSVQEDKHLLKFLGVIPISYAKAQAAAIIALPALFSIIFTRIQKK